MNILITGSSGFIGYHCCKRLLEEGVDIVGLDSMNEYYSKSLKESRLMRLMDFENFKFYEGNLEDDDLLEKVFKNDYTHVINLAAQAGVRYSLTNPKAYINSNIEGFINLLEKIKLQNTIKHTLYASSSSVYGLNQETIFSEEDAVDHPVSLYAATKRSNEIMAHVYSNMFSLPMTGLRFFTVYGPWGRPDMALFHFTKSIIEGKSIEIFNHGQMERDFTYIDDIVEGIIRLINLVPEIVPNAKLMPNSSPAPYKIFNIGNGAPVKLMDFVNALEEKLDKKADLTMRSMQPGDVPKTFANNDNLFDAISYRPRISIKEGISEFVDWYKDYYSIST